MRLFCTKHQSYNGRRAPRTKCEACRTLRELYIRTAVRAGNVPEIIEQDFAGVAPARLFVGSRK